MEPAAVGLGGGVFERSMSIVACVTKGNDESKADTELTLDFRPQKKAERCDNHAALCGHGESRDEIC